MLYGYARVSRTRQDHAGQVQELEAAGCQRIFTEKASAAAGRKRPALRQAVASLAPGDVLVVTRMDRIARSARDGLNTISSILARDAGFRSLREAWADTTTAHGRLVVTIMLGLAEFDREMILERTGEGRAAARARGVKLGRPATLTAKQRDFVREKAAARSMSRGELASLLNVSLSTITRALREPPPPTEPAAPNPQLDIEELTGRPAPAA